MCEGILDEELIKQDRQFCDKCLEKIRQRHDKEKKEWGNKNGNNR